MFIAPIALATILSMQAGAAAGAAQSTSDLELALMAQGDFGTAGNHVTASEHDPQSIDSYVSVTARCGLGISSTMPTTIPAAGWHINGNVVEHTADTITAVVQWQRTWDHGAVAAHPATGVAKVVLKRGETNLLDNIEPDLPECHGASIRLTASAEISPAARRSEIAAMMDHWQFARARGAGASSGTAGAASGSGGVGERAGRNAGGGTSGSGAGARAGGAAVGAGGAARSSGFEPAAPGSIAAVDLWLLDRVDAAANSGAFALNQRYRLISLAAGGADFSFDPLVVTTPHGDVVVRITGRLVPVITNGKLASVDVQITREVKGNGPPAVDVTGGATHTLAPISAADVVAFELPSGEGDDPTLLGGHHLSLRVRVR